MSWKSNQEALSLGSVPEVYQDSFKSEVINSKTPVLVYFSAEWCSPCKTLLPKVAKVVVECKKEVKMVQCDVVKNSGLARKYMVMSSPTIIVFANGKPSFTILSREPDTIQRELNDGL
jgi:thioredoxin 1